MISVNSLLITLSLTTIWICVHVGGHTYSVENNWVEPQLFSLIDSTSLMTSAYNKCCLDNQLYKPGYDICTNSTRDVFHQVETLPIYPSIDNNEDEMSTMTFTLDNLQLVHNEAVLKPCADGFFATSSMLFNLFQNGTLYTHQVGLIEAGQFCIHPVPAATEYLNGQLRYAARFCVRNRCDSATCIRKCCPLGMALVDKTCQSNETPFKVKHYSSPTNQINDDEGNVIRVDSDRANYQIINGLFITCAIQGLNQVFTNDFRILANGHMYVPSYPCEFERPTHQYCIENVIIGNVSSLMALRCFPKIYERNLVVDPVNMTEPIYPYILFVSSLFLIVTFIVYAILPEMRNTHGLVVMSHIASMTFLFIGLGMIHLSIFRPQPGMPSSKACNGLAVVVHFSFLATFAWLQVICFDIWWTFRCSTPKAISFYKPNRRVNSFFFALYSAFGWGLPFLIVLVGQVLEHHYVTDERIITPGFGKFECWFICWEAFVVYLYGPVTVMIMLNIVFFGLTTLHLCRTKRESALAFRNYLSNEQLTRQRVRVFLSLFILMGVSWMTEVISFAIGGSNYRWITTDILNTLTGVFIFIIFVCKARVWKLLKKKFPRLIWFESFLPATCFKIDRKAQSSRTTLSSSARSRSQLVDNHQHQFRHVTTDESATSSRTSETASSWPILLQHQTSFIQRIVPHSLANDTQV